MAKYLETKIVAAKRDYPRVGAGICVDGYTCSRGAPTSIKIQLENEKIWRRVKIWQISNASTLFVTIQKEDFIVCSLDIPEIELRT